MPNQPVATIFIIPFLYLTWLYQVNKTVPEPYLDEVFHARQAQAYCAGKFRAWDPKITTPPGLYILSYVSLKTTQLIFHGGDCYLADLRWTNSLVATFVIPSQAWNLHQQLGLSRRDGQYDKNPVHTVLNICHFPLLFFFSGLYYTDVCSVSFVLGAYQYHIRSLPEAPASRTTDVFKMFGLGFCALLMRQTNIFWVAIFFAGIHAVHHVKRVNRPKLDRSIGSLDVLEAIYDPLVSEAYIEDYVKTAISLAKVAMKTPTALLLTLWPYLTLIALFSTFVFVNGGVVLGDKENHIASIHLPQMLYIWPYIIFFSWPVILPHLIRTISSGDLRSLKSRLPRLIVALPIMTLMALAVHVNTIIHPFTLADNRHYVFYVFRLLLRHPLIRYAAVPIYFFCAWAAITSLSNQSSAPVKIPGEKNSSDSGTIPQKETASKQNPNPMRVSFLLVFLLSTTLSLVTAPLVEPRYFILPWLIWRLHVDLPPPALSPPPRKPTSQTQPTPPMKRLLQQIARADRRTWLYVETAWFLLVNLVTCWVFLNWKFEWTQEPGVVQRFMW